MDSILLTIPEDEYHNATREGKYLSSHMMIDFMRDPLMYKQKMDGTIVQEETASMTIGRATHTLVLEGKDKFLGEYTVSDGLINPKNGEFFGKATKAYKEWLAVQPLPIVSTNEFALMQNIQRSVWTHKEAEAILNNGYAEKVIRFDIDGEPCQARYDWIDLDRGIVADLKTCENLDTFSRDAIKYGYIEQMAFYRKGAKAHGKLINNVFLIAVEKTAPYRCGVFAIAHAALDLAEEKIIAAVGNLKKCRETNIFPTYFEEIRTLDYPAYIYGNNN